MWTPRQRLAANDLSPLALLMQRFEAAPPRGELPPATQALLRARDGGPVSVWDSLHSLP
jgi:hypothetical protein